MVSEKNGHNASNGYSMKFIAIKLIGAYRYLVSPLLGQNCRFYPSCSSYMQQAIHEHGLMKGVFLGTNRLLKCHPWYKGEMLDEVPPKGSDSIAWPALIGYNRFGRLKRKKQTR
jgi:putative membrane protein insertion efficiency factor